MNDIQLKVLPYSARQYFVNEVSEVFNALGERIPEIKINDKISVKINWYDGEKDYELGLIVLSAFGKIGHDYTLYNRVDVIYRDGNNTNIFASNLICRFSGPPIESHIPGFFLIPGFSRYVINRSGEVYNLLKNKTISWATSKAKEGNRLGGYKYRNFLTDYGSITTYRHRLLCLVFIPFTGVFNKLTVNHKDGIKSNNDLNNLEWVTYSENNKHAWDSGLKLNNRPRILKRNLLTGKIDSYRSVRECAYSLGDTSGFYVTQRLKDQSGGIYPDYLLFKRDDGSDWPEVDYSKIPSVPSSYQNVLVARNVFTGRTYAFDNLQEFSKQINVSTTVIVEHARVNQVIPSNGYNFRYLINSNTWPNHTEKHLLVYKDYPERPADGVIMMDHETMQDTFFTSCYKVIEKMGIHEDHLRTLIYSGRRFNKRYTFKLFKLKENL
jgi:HNH endonuclease